MNIIKTKLIQGPVDIIYKFLFYFVFYYSFVVNVLTYSVINSPDFAKYYRYFEFYSGNINNVNLEQGHFYFFINYLVVLIISGLNDYFTVNEIVNFSIHIGNSLIFL